MSQKTNPISLRLLRGHKHFESCWYSDYFYGEFISHNLQFGFYIQSVFDQISFARALLYTQNYYKRSVIYMFTQDARGIRSEREQFLRSSFTGGKKKRIQLPVPVNTMAQAKVASILFFWHKRSFNLFLFKSKKHLSRNFTQRYLSPTLGRDASTFFDESTFMTQAQPGTGVPSTMVECRVGAKNLSKQTLLRFFQPLSGRHNFFQKVGVEKDEASSQLSSTKQEVFNHFSGIQSLETTIISTVHANSSYSLNFTSIYPIRIIQDIQNASFLINEITNLLQKRVGFRLIKDQILREILNTVGRKNKFELSVDHYNQQLPPKEVVLHSHKMIKGVRLSCSGRFGGRSKKAQKTKTQSIRWGETSLHVFDSKLSFASKSANTPFGKIGVKLWICFC